PPASAPPPSSWRCRHSSPPRPAPCDCAPAIPPTSPLPRSGRSTSRWARSRWRRTSRSGVVAVDGLGDAGGLVLALDLEAHVDGGLDAAAYLLEVGKGGVEAHLATDRYRRREAQLVEPVVDAHGEALDAPHLRQQVRRQGEGEVSVGDGAAERARLGPLRIDVDPLVVTGGVGELVDLLLGDLVPLARGQRLADQLAQALDAVHGRRHASRT